MQDIVVAISLDTRVKPRETLLPLILTDDMELPYQEFSSADEIGEEYGLTTKVYACAKALFGQTTIASGAIAKCAVIGVEENATDTEVVATLDDLRTEHDDWYFLIPVVATMARIQVLAEWTERTLLSDVEIRQGAIESEKLLVAQISDVNFYNTRGLSVVVYNPDPDTYAHAAWVGRTAPYFPEATTWKWKELYGIKPCGLSGLALQTLLERNINAYITNNKRNYMSDGVCSDGEFIDSVIARWQIKQTLREGLTAYLVDTPTVPYDNDGFAQIGAVVHAQLSAAVGYGVILPGFKLTIPTREESTREQAALRRMPPILWQATLRGSVHGVEIKGTLTVDLLTT